MKAVGSFVFKPGEKGEVILGCLCDHCNNLCDEGTCQRRAYYDKNEDKLVVASNYKSKHNEYNVRLINRYFRIQDHKLRLFISRQLKKYLEDNYAIKDNYLDLEIPECLKLKGRIKHIKIKRINKREYKVCIVKDIPYGGYRYSN